MSFKELSMTKIARRAPNSNRIFLLHEIIVGDPQKMGSPIYKVDCFFKSSSYFFIRYGKNEATKEHHILTQHTLLFIERQEDLGYKNNPIVLSCLLPSNSFSLSIYLSIYLFIVVNRGLVTNYVPIVL